jgi:hypothetical protein
MTNPAELETSERYMAIARRWFTEGWTGNLAMADDIFAEDLRTNGVRVGVAGPPDGRGGLAVTRADRGRGSVVRRRSVPPGRRGSCRPTSRRCL